MPNSESVRTDSSPEQLLAAMYHSSGRMLTALNGAFLPSEAVKRRDEFNRIRRLVASHLRQAKEKDNGSRDLGN